MHVLLVEIGTPYLVVLLGAGIAFASYIVRELNRQQKDTAERFQRQAEKTTEELNRLARQLVELRTGFRFFVQQMGKGAATILDSNNPTPEPMRQLLRKYRDGTLTDAERIDLVAFLKTFVKDESIRKSERSAAWQVLAAINTLSQTPKEQQWTFTHNSH